jgi:hypothetical protein
VLACVDSGAGRTYFPLEIAGLLGLTGEDLVVDPHVGKGVGSEFRTWSSKVPILGRVAAFISSEPEPWGPHIPLSPAFGQHRAFLLGRADFFRVFTVTFQEHASDPVFHVDYEEG